MLNHKLAARKMTIERETKVMVLSSRRRTEACGERSHSTRNINLAANPTPIAISSLRERRHAHGDTVNDAAFICGSTLGLTRYRWHFAIYFVVHRCSLV